jgi:hypothetical protein
VKKINSKKNKVWIYRDRYGNYTICYDEPVQDDPYCGVVADQEILSDLCAFEFHRFICRLNRGQKQFGTLEIKFTPEKPKRAKKGSE